MLRKLRHSELYDRMIQEYRKIENTDEIQAKEKIDRLFNELDSFINLESSNCKCKTTHTSSNSVSVWHRGAARPARSRVACNTPRSYAQM